MGQVLYGQATPFYSTGMTPEEIDKAEDQRIGEVYRSLTYLPFDEQREYQTLLERQDGKPKPIKNPMPTKNTTPKPVLLAGTGQFERENKKNTRPTATRQAPARARSQPLEQPGAQQGAISKPKSNKSSMHPRNWARTKEGRRERANQALDNYEQIGESLGLKHAVDYLKHFREGSGKDIVIPRDEARKRDFVIEGEKANEKRFEEAFTIDRLNPPFWEDAAEESEYRSHLMNMKDGSTIRLPKGSGKPDKPRDHFDFIRSKWRSLLFGDVDEAMAMGDTSITSKAYNGFVAKRRGDKITMEGIVVHELRDPYDFDKGILSRNAEFVRDFGNAKEFDIKSEWHKHMKAEFEIKNGELELQSIKWEDIPLEGEY